MADYWLKLYVEILDDPKMATLPDRLWRRVVELFLAAKRYNKGGRLPPLAELAWMLRMDASALAPDMDSIENCAIIRKDGSGWIVTNFASRQGASTDAERKQRQRDSERFGQYSGAVTKRDEQASQQKPEANTDADAEKSEAAADKKIAKLPPEERAWLQRIVEAFGEKFHNPFQVKTALQIRSTFGEARGWEALEYYAGKSYPIGEACARAFRALPNWGSWGKAVGASNGNRGGNGSASAAAPSRFDVEFAITDMGWTVEQCRQRMLELGIAKDVIDAQLSEIAT